ncbi:MAG: cation:proton antiporter [Gammaproteobacteria bacterium]|nr:cation:proton antiporter [Gammaproteobacteria bacterium]
MHGIEASIELQMSLLLFVSLLGYLIAVWLNQSAVIGSILLGIIIGPSLLNWISYTSFVSNIAHLGAIILLFVVGLEFRMSAIAQWRNFWIALAGVIIPWFSGWSLALAFGFQGNAAIFIGTALTATSIAITANVLHEQGLLKSEIASVIIGAAVIDDILSLLILSLTEQLGHGTLSASTTALLAFKAVGFIIVGVFVGKKIFIESLIKLEKTRLVEKYPEFIFVLIMMVAFLYAMIASLAGLSAIVGAFLAGVILEGVKLKNTHIFHDGANYLRIIFAAIFFVSLGILADLKQLDVNTVIFIIVLSIIAFLSKFVGCGLVAKLQKMDWRSSFAVGVGMSPRGEVAMIVALIGLKQEIIGQKTYVSLVLMSILTTLIVPLLLKKLLKNSVQSDR